MARNPGQWLRSSYALFFQLSWLPEWVLRARDWTLLPDCPAPDVRMVPGGLGTRTEMNNEALIGWTGQAAANAAVVLSVCTGALLLARAGLLDGLATTTHHGAIDLLRQVAPRTTIREGVQVVDNENLVTSPGIDTALQVVGKLHGQEQAQKTAQ